MTAADARALLALQIRNREFLSPFDPERPESFYSLSGQEESAAAAQADRENGRSFAFCIVESGSDAVVGRLALANVVRGCWQNATLGYFVDQARGGRGYATQAVHQALNFAFGPAALHRVQAAVMPNNPASARVLAKNGFRLEGFSPRYVQIAGAWRDHDVYAITSEEWP